MGNVLNASLSVSLRFHYLRRDRKWNLYLLYIYLLDVEPAATLHEENKQYTVKRSEPRYNRDILIYSLISSLLCELDPPAFPPSLSFSFNYPSFSSLRPTPLSFLDFFHATIFSLFHCSQLFLLSPSSILTTPHPPKPLDALIRGLVWAVSSPSYWEWREKASKTVIKRNQGAT